MKRQSLGVLLSFAMLASLAAFAERVSENTTVTLTANSGTAYEIDDGITLTIEVGSGSTYELSGQITGTGTAKLRKTGLGTLVLSNGNNDIPGGINIAQGTIQADVEGCLGSAPITLSQTTANRGQIAFNAADATFYNTISITGSAGNTFNASSPYALKFMKSATLKGNVTSSGQYTSFWNEDVAGLTAVFDGDVTCSAGSNRLYLRPNGTTVFNGAVTANRFRLGNSTSSTAPVYLNNPRNAITYLDTYSPRVHCGDTNVLAGAYWTMPGANSRAKDRDSLYLHGHDQTMLYLDNVATGSVAADTRCPISSDEPCTLTLNGSGTRNSAHVLLGAVSLVINGSSKSFVQEFSEVKSTVDTIHSTTGTITVKKGTLKISGVKTAFSGVPEITVEKDGTLDISTSGQTVFTSVTNILVEGTLAIGQNAATPIAIGIANLTLGSNATFTASNDQKVNFNEVYVVEDGGKRRLPAGNYTAGDENVPQLLAGGFTVLNGATVVTEATWTGGGGSDTSIANEDNWSKTGIDLDAGVLNATFASAGATATVNKVVMFDNMVLSAAEGEAGFTFAKGAEDAAVVFAGTALDITDTDSTARTYRFDVPVGVSGVQKLAASVPSSKTLVLGAGVDVNSGSLQFTDGGTVRMFGDSVLEGSCSLASGMTLFLSGTISVPGGADQGAAYVDGAKTFTVNGGTTESSDLKGLVLTNATIRKPVAIKGNSSNSQKWLLHTLAGTTNEISGNVLFNVGYGRNNMKLRRNSELTLSGGMRTTKSTLCIDGDAGSRLLFTGNPVTSTIEYDYNGLNYYFGLGIFRGSVVFDVCENAINYLRVGMSDTANYASKVDFMRSDMFSGYATTLAAGMSNSGATLTPHTKATSQTVDFHSTTQRFARVVSGATAKFCGDAGSLLEVYGALAPDSGEYIHVTDNNLYVAAKFEGGLSLKMGGTGTLLLTNAVSSTSGGIEVTNGTVKIASDAAWTNAAYVAVGGTGRFEIAAAEGELGRLHKLSPETVVFLSDDGVVSVPNGTEIKVANIFVDGVALPPGRYSYASAPEPLKSHLADTTGEIVAGKPGLVIFLR